MKTHLMGMKVSVSTAAFFAAFVLFAAPVHAEDLNAVYQQGRAAFYQGDFDKAQQLLARVAAANPKHPDTLRMLAYIRANHKPAENTLKNQYAAVILPKVEMSEVSLTEAIEGLRTLSKNASGGKVVPNVIIKGEEVGQRKLTLALSNIPLSEALNYVTQLTGTKATYDKHAVILSATADTSTSTAEIAPKDSK
ncbi:tetratricopeptide repeat protein [Prosthecobacter sp.]|uniref:tetratricopeptide repeat protein n=1 Tax=Prosthecobacter sp. TaxID=1965333 RepID=UPI003784AB3D